MVSIFSVFSFHIFLQTQSDIEEKKESNHWDNIDLGEKDNQRIDI